MGKKNQRRKHRISFCEWHSVSFGHFNTGGIICETCNFHRTLLRGEGNGGTYHTNNKIDRDFNCPKCQSRDWYWLPPIARVPRLCAPKTVWNKFWKKLKNREFNHPKGSCR